MARRSILTRKFGLALVRDPQGAAVGFPGGISFHTNLDATVIRDGKPIAQKHVYHPSLLSRFFTGWDPESPVIKLGSGLVTNVGVMAMANDFNWAQNAQTLKLMNFHASGTGATAAAATDIALQTLAAPTATTAVTGAQSFISAANSQTYKSIATISYAAPLAITEWGIHSAAALSVTTGTPFTATSATSGTVTGTPYSASSSSVQGEQQLVARPGTTAVYGLVTSNTTSVLNVPAWYKVSDGTAGSTPGATEAFTLIPVLWDHKVFGALNVVSGDAIQFTYSLTINSGG